MRSDIPSIVWPTIHTGYNATLAALIFELTKTQYMPLDLIHRNQSQQLHLLARHHAANTPSFRDRLTDAGLSTDNMNIWKLKKLPTINKAYIQQCGQEFTCKNVPQDHHPIGEAKTSGSTGQPITVMRSVFTQVLLEAMTFRDHIWNKRNFNYRMCAIRANIDKAGTHPNWGIPVNRLSVTGPGLTMNVSSDIDEIMKNLREFQPEILTIHAGALREMIYTWKQQGFDLHNLKHLKNIGDTVSDELRTDIKNLTGLNIEDTYSSSETGPIAIQCPEGNMYHVCTESLIVEILREDGTDCAPGEIGRVVITDLHNFASPVIRYDIGDFAEVGSGCTCGRTLPTLKRIVGRERNTFTRPDGSRFWPKAGMHEIPTVVSVKQWQIIQHSVDHVEYKLVTDVDINAEQENKIIEIIEKNLGYKPHITVSTQRDFMPRAANGKFEEAICLIKR